MHSIDRIEIALQRLADLDPTGGHSDADLQAQWLAHSWRRSRKVEAVKPDVTERRKLVEELPNDIDTILKEIENLISALKVSFVTRKDAEAFHEADSLLDHMTKSRGRG